MPEPSNRLGEVVEELARSGSSGFLASHVAHEAAIPLPDARRGLTELVNQGDLEVQYELLCPDNGRSIATSSQLEDLPIGEEIQDERCESDEPFAVAREDVWVRFLPSHELLLRVNRESAGSPPKKKGRQAASARRATSWVPSSLRSEPPSRRAGST